MLELRCINTVATGSLLIVLKRLCGKRVGKSVRIESIEMLTPEEKRRRKREYQKRYRAENPEIMKAQKRRWSVKYAERIAAKTREWKLNNPEKLALDKEVRCTRAKNARVLWDKELTDFVMSEAIDLRKRRKEAIGFNWHIDHIIPLKGANVCGLHVWNNLRVIPESVNLSKGNTFDESLLT